MNTLKFCGTNISKEMEELVEKSKAEITNAVITVDSCPEERGTYDSRYSAIVNGMLVTGDSTHALFEQI